MTLSDFYLSTIIEVRADFGFEDFQCDPDDITEVIGISPDEVYRKGDVFPVGIKTRTVARSSWSISSHTDSKDINVHLREVLDRLISAPLPFPQKWGKPSFNVLWKGNYLCAGSGPFYETDVLQAVSALGADLWQDIYQVDQDENEPIGDDGLKRIEKS